MAALLKGISSTFGSSASSTQANGKGNKRKRNYPFGVSAALSGIKGIKRRAIGAASPQVRVVSRGESALAATAGSLPIPFSVLADGPYFVVASWLDAVDLSRTDATCRLLRDLNVQPFGPWQNLGTNVFFGMELDMRGGFFPFEDKLSQHNWKAHYKTFKIETPTFAAPFQGSKISAIERPDEVAYCRCRLRTDLLLTRSDFGTYVEVEIAANADNLSLAVVDFEGGGRSSVTFSPETGAVLRERKVREAPRAIEGTYIHLLPAAPGGLRFEGLMGLYLRGGQLAFFRKWTRAPVPPENDEAEEADANVEPTWETTGFCTDMEWASGQRLSVCLAFRDSGEYNVRIVKLCRTPPIAPQRSEIAFQEGQWNHLYGDDDHPLAI